MKSAHAPLKCGEPIIHAGGIDKTFDTSGRLES